MNIALPPLSKMRQLNKLLVKTIFQTLGIILNISYQWDCSNIRYLNEKILQKLPAKFAFFCQPISLISEI